jgi:hypothetical protein
MVGVQADEIITIVKLSRLLMCYAGLVYHPRRGVSSDPPPLRLLRVMGSVDDPM